MPTFTLPDRLPTIYDAVIMIRAETSGWKGPWYQRVVHSYADALTTMWIKCFGEKHVLEKSNVIIRLDKYMRSYFSFMSGRRRYGDVRRGVAPTSIRLLNKQWRHKNVSTFYYL